MDSCLMVGPPGVGKSALARVIAAEMATEFTEVWSKYRLAGGPECTSSAAKDNAIVHVDEAHELRKTFRRPGIWHSTSGNFACPVESLQSLPLADFTVSLSTTDEYCLSQPLRDRMRLLLRFEFIRKRS